MPRKTRAAVKAQEAPEEIPLPATPHRERDHEPLRTITPHSEDSDIPAEEMMKPKGKKGKKGGAKKKGKKTTKEQGSEEQQGSIEEQIVQDAPEDLEDDEVEVGAEVPLSEEAAEHADGEKEEGRLDRVW